MDLNLLHDLRGRLHRGVLVPLIVGGPKKSFGAREHALFDLFLRAGCSRVIALPGNGGIPSDCIYDDAADPEEFNRNVLQAAKANNIDCVVIGPEAAAVAGLVDLLERYNIPAFGTPAEGAELEASKSWMKAICKKYGVQTALPYISTAAPRTARTFIRKHGVKNIVVKADGLCGGKGVTLPDTLEEAFRDVDDCLKRGVFGQEGIPVVIEPRLHGREASYFVFWDGRRFKFIGTACDYKRRYDSGHEGPNKNTGGMGAYSPSPDFDDKLMRKVEKKILEPLARAFRELNISYRGVLFLGLMLVETADWLEPYLLEINVRFGDPETQVLIPRFEPKGFAENMLCTMFEDGLEQAPPLQIMPGREAAVGMVQVRREYPDSAKGEPPPIYGIEKCRESGALVFMAGANWSPEHPPAVQDHLLATGGRVLTVVRMAPTVAEARLLLYSDETVLPVFEGADWRAQIGEGVS